jgi:hypothetical protein
MHPCIAFAGAEASAACAPSDKPIAASETLAKRILFIVVPQTAVTDAFRRSRYSVNLRKHLCAGALRRIDVVCRTISLKKNN